MKGKFLILYVLIALFSSSAQAAATLEKCKFKPLGDK